MTKVTLLLQGLHDNHYYDDGYLIDPLTSSVTLIQTGKHKILFDTGTPNFKDNILTSLAEEGIEPAEIDYLVLSHSHLDHVFNAHLFPKALIYTKMAFWHWQDSNCRIYRDGIPPDAVPGVELIHTPGHTQDSLSLYVQDSEGKKWVMAGDAVNVHYLENGSFKKRLGEEGIASLHRILDLKPDYIVPGHGEVLGKEEIGRMRELLLG